jgi:hypothetical protein
MATVMPRAGHETGDFAQTLRLARAEFLEMPGLKLTVRQAARLWAADQTICSDVLSALVESRLLVRVGDAYARASCC